MQYINTGMAFYPDGTPYEVIIPIRKLMDKQHVNMLHFLNADIRPLEDRVSAYIREIKGGARYDVPDAVYREFSVLHPYYSLNKANVSIFLNRVFACFVKETYADENKQREMMTSLYAGNGLTSECNTDFWLFEDFSKRPFSPDVVTSPLLFLKKIQNSVREAAVFLLDDSVSLFSGISPYKRISLYGAVGSEGFGGPADGFIQLGRMTFTYGYVQGTDARSLASRIDFAEDGDVLTAEHIRDNAKALSSNPSADVPALAEAISCLDDNGRTKMDEILVPQSFEELLQYEIKEMVIEGFRLQRNGDGNFIIPDGRPGSSVQTEPEDIDTCLQNEYKRAYRTHHKRIRYGLITKAALDAWVNEAKSMMEMVKKGEMTISEFAMWAKR